MMTEDFQRLITEDEHRELEVKQSTGELKVGMHSACAFLNTDGGWLIFGIKPKSLKILGERILKKYPESVIDIRESYIRLAFPFAKGYRQASGSAITDSSIADNVGNPSASSPIITDNSNLGSQPLASDVEGRYKKVGIHANSAVEGRNKKVGIKAVSSKDVGKTAERLLELLKEYPHMTISAAANVLGIVPRVAERYIRTLKNEGKLKRVGSRKKAFWQVIC